MGGGGSKKKRNIVQQEARKPPIQVEVTMKPPTPPQSPPLPSTQSRQPSARSPSPTAQSRVSIKRSSINVTNDVEDRIAFRKLSSNVLQEYDNGELPTLDNRSTKSPSRLSTRSSTVLALPVVNSLRSRSNSNSSSGSFKRKHRRGSPLSHEHGGRCSKCPHCQRLAKLNKESTPVPPWITKNPGTDIKNPGTDQIRINMDKYDVEAEKNKTIAKTHHLLGSYDYHPYLTIEQNEGDYDQRKENYYTQPMIAKMKPRITASRTPFPEYELLQRREQRLNKPYTLPLFD